MLVPVDAAYKAIGQMVGLSSNLVNFTLQSISGTEALGEVVVRIFTDDTVYVGRGLSSGCCSCQCHCLSVGYKQNDSTEKLNLRPTYKSNRTLKYF